jgi:hypothetical protein
MSPTARSDGADEVVVQLLVEVVITTEIMVGLLGISVTDQMACDGCPGSLRLAMGSHVAVDIVYLFEECLLVIDEVKEGFTSSKLETFTWWFSDAHMKGTPYIACPTAILVYHNTLLIHI